MNEIEGLMQVGATWSTHPSPDLESIVRRGKYLRRRRRVALLASLTAVTVGSWLVAGALTVGEQSARRGSTAPASEGAIFGDSCIDADDPQRCEQESTEEKGPLFPDHGEVRPGPNAQELREMRRQMRDFFDCLAGAGYDFRLRNIGAKGLPIYEPVDSSQFVYRGTDAKGTPLYEPVEAIVEEFHAVEDRCAADGWSSPFDAQ